MYNIGTYNTQGAVALGGEGMGYRVDATHQRHYIREAHEMDAFASCILFGSFFAASSFYFQRLGKFCR